ncbi:hypothetical protein OHA72_56675 [Dactylosporangium sp. NBC_01737]|uniref:P-type ATPase n=1 Tax=Dactylosporangium sp. NBC_01737 TaxID=2975959 RepID=UPI002E14CAB4|nr:hypothetical protein OHA72_56675 [Dactylosporangium sp. NBC_01737]
MSVPAGDLVPNDLVRVEAGDIIPADLRVVEAVRLTLDESALTGESMTVAKDVDEELFAGTVTATGRAAGVVVRTGPHSTCRRARHPAGRHQQAPPARPA